MSMNREQFKFSQDVMALMNYIWSQGWRITFGEAHRTESQALLYYHGFEVVQEGNTIKLKKGKRRSNTTASRHRKRLAIDFNFFKPDGPSFTLTYDKDELQQFGDYWESLSPENQWGGNWEAFLDTPHFERRA